jgi:hypothetical protein
LAGLQSEAGQITSRVETRDPIHIRYNNNIAGAVSRCGKCVGTDLALAEPAAANAAAGRPQPIAVPTNAFYLVSCLANAPAALASRSTFSTRML